jgi:hypothetical protein
MSLVEPTSQAPPRRTVRPTLGVSSAAGQFRELSATEKLTLAFSKTSRLPVYRSQSGHIPEKPPDGSRCCAGAQLPCSS